MELEGDIQKNLREAELKSQEAITKWNNAAKQQLAQTQGEFGLSSDQIRTKSNEAIAEQKAESDRWLAKYAAQTSKALDLAKIDEDGKIKKAIAQIQADADIANSTTSKQSQTLSNLFTAVGNIASNPNLGQEDAAARIQTLISMYNVETGSNLQIQNYSGDTSVDVGGTDSGK